MLTSEIPSVDFDSAKKDYWHQVRKSEVKASIWRSNMCGMITGLLPFDCVRYSYPYFVLVNLYAKVGLHRYNMLKSDVFSQLEILKVATETGTEDVEPPNERLKAKTVDAYIKFKGMANVITPRMIFEIGERVECRAVVRRVLDEHSGYMTLLGKFCGGQSTQKLIQSSRKRPRSD
ncbi:unnamed protein product [Brassica oleracea]